jgi:capsular exopolysaccharide synthesis family protein
VPNTHILELSCDSLYSRLAAAVANAWAHEFVEQNAEARVDVTRQTEKALRAQLDQAQARVEKAEEELLAYARQANLTFTGDEHQTNILEEKLQQVQTSLSEAEKDRALKQSQYEISSTAPLDTLPQLLDDTTSRDGEAKLLELRRELADLRSYMAPGHPRVQRLESQVHELEQNLAKQADRVSKRIANEYHETQRRESLLKSTYDEQSKALAGQAEKTIRYKILRREADINRSIYESLLQRTKEAGVAAAMRANNVRLIDAAQVPLVPYKPRPLANAAIGLIVGLFAGVAFVVMRERADHNIRLPGEATSCLKVPELGAIPSTGEPLVSRLLPSGSAAPEPAAWQQGSPLVLDSVRATLASLLLSPERSDRFPATVVTSVGPDEGKSTIVVNLGLAMAETHRRVLLVDANLRRPRLHEIFRIPNTFGLSDLLEESDFPGEPTASGVVRIGQTELFVLPSGGRTGNISNLLYSARLPKLLDRLRLEFDAVLIDTPPMIQVADARVLGRVAGGVVMVIRAGHTSRDMAVAARRRFAEDGTPVIGVILNDWDMKSTNSLAYKQYHRANRSMFNGNGRHGV